MFTGYKINIKNKLGYKSGLFNSALSLNRSRSGFTIVELLVVIVVIGILAAITVVSYTGITQKANQSTLTSDLANAKKKLQLYYAEYNSYPTALDTNYCPTAPTVNAAYCLKPSPGNTFTYYGNASNYTVTASKGTVASTISTNTTPTAISIAQPKSCPTGYIPVPGSLTYGTSGFCVMKYEAKIQGNDVGNQTYSAAFVPESRVTGTPWVNISQTNAIAEAATACAGCSLISEAQWMTIAQNVLSVPSNWSTGTVGSGFIYSGHNDNAPAYSLAASTDNNGYSGTGQTTGSNQRRTLTLTNGEVIWDIAGNVWEWTAGQVSGGQPGLTTDTTNTWKEWTTINTLGTISINPSPVGTGLIGANTWTTANGLGGLYSNSSQIALRVFCRSGGWQNNVNAGVLTLSFNGTPSDIGGSVGFRIVAPSI